jgi:4-hydroxyphenylpyruvate dioxygenase
MEQCWEIEFHTEDVAREEARDFGTGLRSVVMWDPRSGLKFPINEPLAPFFKDGQINRFIEDNAGAGVQHVALEVDDIVHSVQHLRHRGVRFLKTPKVYYEMAAPRLREQGVEPSALAHSLELLEPLGILIDGSPVNNYLIQIFLEDAMTLYDEPSAGPFFYELIQRCGDQGFGGGNFRALFEAIERAQIAETRAA